MKLKQLIVFSIITLIFFVFAGCSQKENIDEVSKKVENLEKQIETMNMKIESLLKDSEGENELEEDEIISETDIDKSDKELSYNIITDALGKGYIMSGMEESLLSCDLWKNSEEFFVLLEYDFPLTDKVIEQINENILKNFGEGSLDIDGSETTYAGDGYFIPIREESNNMISVGIESSNIDTVSRVYELVQKYFNDYEYFKISEAKIDEYGLTNTTYKIHIEKNNLNFISLKWELSSEQAEKLCNYYSDVLSGENIKFDDLDTEAFETQIQGFSSDGIELIFSASLFDGKYEASIQRLY